MPHLALLPQIRDHLRSFLVGSVAALGFGYYKLNQNLLLSADSVRAHLEKLGDETVSSHAVLQQRVVTLEAEVTKLKEQLNSK